MRDPKNKSKSGRPELEQRGVAPDLVLSRLALLDYPDGAVYSKRLINTSCTLSLGGVGLPL